LENHKIGIHNILLKATPLMKTQVYFRFREHPGYLFRDTDLLELPDPDKDQDSFLVQFLPNYQSSQTVAYLNDLYKLRDYDSDEDRANIIDRVGDLTSEEVENEIDSVTQVLYFDALINFYDLVLNNKIEIVNEEEK